MRATGTRLLVAMAFLLFHFHTAFAQSPPSITSFTVTPSTGLVAPATVTLAAGVFKPPGTTIGGVTFYSNGAQAGIDNTTPYQLVLNGLPAGTYTFHAVAAGSEGSATSGNVTVTVATPNQLPSLSITTPIEGAAFVAPATIAVAANASDADGSVARVEFYGNSALLASDTASPYQATWSGIAVGASHTIEARAFDNAGGMTSLSRIVRVNPVQQPFGGTAPSVSATVATRLEAENYDLGGQSGTNGDTGAYNDFTPGNAGGALRTDDVDVYPLAGGGSYVGDIGGGEWLEYTINAAQAGYYRATVRAATPHGSMEIRLYVDGVDVTGPFDVTYTAGWTNWNNTVRDGISIGAGLHTLRIVSDSGGINFDWFELLRNQPPTVSLDAPPNNSLYTAPATVAMAATAADTDGTISRVEFFQGATLLGTDPSAPFTASWTNAPAGSHALSAKAYDNFNQVAMSNVSNIVINQLPTISLTQPASGTTFVEPATIALAASAADSDGTVTLVEFFNGATLLGTDSASPYQFSWTNVALGSYALSARVTDNRGAVVSSSSVSVSVNRLPIVSITAPASGSVLLAPAAFTLAATASDVGGTISHVQFYRDATLLGQDSTAPFEWAVSSLSAGTYAFTAQATDNLGGTATSSAVSIISNAAPTVTMNAPANGAVFVAPATITLSATAADADGSVARVEFYSGSTLLASDNTAPFSHDWTGVSAGAYALSAKAFDNRGAQSAPATANVVVGIPPAVSLSSPASGATFVAPASIAVSASASDTDGTVQRVELFAGSSQLANLTAAPYTHTWTNVSAGSYTLIAKAYDNHGLLTESSSVSITVSPPNQPPVVAVTQPTSGTMLVASADVPIAAQASDPDGSVVSVQFFVDGASLGTDATAPFAATWNNAAAGNHALTARATDNSGQTAESSPVTVIINAAPTVTLTSPPPAASYPVGATISIAAAASDSDQTIARVAFYDGATLMHEDTTPPYTYEWTAATAGDHALTAVAYDTGAVVASAVSAPSSVTVGTSNIGFGSCGSSLRSEDVLASAGNAAEYLIGRDRLARWTNVKRPGSGWDFFETLVHLPPNNHPTLHWYTFDVQGRPTWLFADGPTPPGTGFANLPLFLGEKVGLGDSTKTQAGTVSLTFSVNGDKNLAEVVWTLNATGASRLGAIAGEPYTECLFNFSKSISGTSTPVGPSERYSGLWNLGDENLGPNQGYRGITLQSYFRRLFTDRDSNGRLDEDAEYEQSILSFYNVNGEPRWVTGQGRGAGIRPQLSSRNLQMRYVLGYCAACDPPDGWTQTGPIFNLTRSFSEEFTNLGEINADFRTGGAPTTIGSGPAADQIGFSTGGTRGMGRGSEARVDYDIGIAPRRVPATPLTINPAERLLSDQVGATTGTFRVDESGSATYSIPLATAPASGGFAPRISLEYSSSTGDGILGVGWSIGGLSSIVRCRRTVESGDGPGPHPPVNFSTPYSATTDVFCWDGQRLIEVAGPGSDTNGAYLAEFRTEIDSFNRIRAYADGAVSPGWFAVWGKDGTYREYGRSSVRGSRLMVNNNGVANPNIALVWAVDRVSDAATNRYEYVYTKNDNEGEQVLSRIDYTANATAGTGHSARFDFDYVTRVDPIVQYVSGARTTSAKYLTRIHSLGLNASQAMDSIRSYELLYETSPATGRMRVQMLSECSNSTLSTCYPPMRFRWTTATNTLETTDSTVVNTSAGNLKGIKFGDLDANGRSDMVWVENRTGGKKVFVAIQDLVNTSANNALGFGAGTEQPGLDLPDAAGNNDDSGNNNRTWHLFDFNSDGRDDLLALSRTTGTWTIYPSTGSGFDTLSAKDTQIGTAAADEAMLADIDGDGLADFIYSDSDSQTPRLWVRSIKHSAASPNTCSGSTGDLQFCISADARAFTFRNVGGAPLTLPGVSASCPSVKLLQSLTNPERIQVFDANADGRADLRVRVRAPSSCNTTAQAPRLEPTIVNGVLQPMPEGGGEVELWGLFLSAGTAADGSQEVFEKYATWDITVDGDGDQFLVGDDDGAFHIGDFNGDGLADVFYRSAYFPQQDLGERWFIQFNTGKGFGGRGTHFEHLQLEVLNSKIQVLDYNGDGRSDLLLPIDRRADPGDSDKNDTYFNAHCSGAVSRTDFPFMLFAWTGNPTDHQGLTSGTCLPAAAYGGGTLSSLLDVDADGGIDAVSLKESNGSIKVRRVAAQSRYKPRDRVREIETALGGVTSITYAPLTFASVYKRGYNWGQTSGRSSSPIFAVVGPMQVVHEVWTSAPSAIGDASGVRYLYKDATAQSGGRGWLGFRAIATIDLQPSADTRLNPASSGQVTEYAVTYYYKTFPFIGRPSRTLSGLIDYSSVVALSAGACGNPDSPTCMPPWHNVDEVLPHAPPWHSMPFLLATNVSPLSVSQDSVSQVQAPSARVARVVLTTSMKQDFSIDGDAVRRTHTSFSNEQGSDGYDEFGNLRFSRTQTTECVGFPAPGGWLGGSECFGAPDEGRIVRTENLFDTSSARISAWQLGRLTQSTVSTTLRGSTPRDRTTTFEYDGTSGLLSAEHLMPESTDPSHRLDTFHTRDAFGNITLTITCSGFDRSICRAVDGQGVPVGVPKTNSGTSLRRYTRQVYDDRGRFVVEERRPYTLSSSTFATDLAASTSTLFDQFGNPRQVQTIAGAQTTSTYGAMGRLFQTFANTGATARVVYAWCSGRNGGTTPCPAGASYRVAKVVTGAPSIWSYHDILGREVLVVSQGLVDNTFSAVETQYDYHGRIAKVSTPYFTHPVSQSNIGAVAPGEDRYYSETKYDALGRPREVRAPLPEGATAVSSVSYRAVEGGVETTTTNPRGKTRKELHNGLDQLIRATDDDGTSICYTHGVAGGVERVYRSLQACTTVLDELSKIEFDELGRKTRMSDADMGGVDTRYWTYTYNAAGELLTQSTPRGTCTVNTHDLQGRLVERRVYASGCQGSVDSQTTWQYDGIVRGVLSSDLLTNASGQLQEARSYGYDGFGRSVSVLHTIHESGSAAEPAQYRTHATYDEFGRIFQKLDAATPLTYVMDGPPEVQPVPTGLLFQYRNGHLHRLREVWPAEEGEIYWQAQEADARGNVTTEWRAVRDNGSDTLLPDLTLTRVFEKETGRLRALQAYDTVPYPINQPPTSVMQDWTYGYDAVGNLASRHNLRDNWSETFGYDDLDRLASVVPVGFGTQTSFSYDGARGNLLSRTTAGTLTYDRQLKPTCSAVAGSVAPGPHAVTSASAGGNQFCYDANGNQLGSFDGRRLLHTAADQVHEVQVPVAGGTRITRFGYGVDRQRVYRRDIPSGVGQPRLIHYLGDVEVSYGVVETEYKRYIGGVLVATWTDSGGGSREYVFTDQQGSTDTLSDRFGNFDISVAGEAIGEKQLFEPFGWRRNELLGTPLTKSATYSRTEGKTRRGYTGHEQVDNVGLVHMNGRMYDAYLGRFVQADPYIQNPSDTQSLNRYSYVQNNPMSLTDPSGHFSVGWRDVAAAAIAIYSGGAAAGYWSFFGATVDSAAGAYAVAATGGATAGAIQTGTLKGAVHGAVSAAVFHGIGASSLGTYDRIVAHAVAGSFLEEISGGNFGHGFVRAGLSKALTPLVDTGSLVVDGVAHAVIGGTISHLAGDKFANGALSSVFQYAFNQLFSITNMHTEQAKLNEAYHAKRIAIHPEEYFCIVPMKCASADYLSPEPGLESVDEALFTSVASAPAVLGRLWQGFRMLSRAFWAPRLTLYHYTDAAGLEGILGSNRLYASLRSTNPRDVRYGEGQYLSDIAPGTMTCAQLSRCFIGQPFQGRRFTNFVEIDVTGLNVIQGRAGVLVVPNQTPLDLTGRIVRSGTN